ncbi:MAG: GntR family transcriptional regulator, transcriptional repressor for pyruvate dehydrogenase complex [Solirubrobacteraceae bacterium]|jgi:DNA-binding FadR family transcriptional regulator|nr:GntR family transcriptional regulator, transcriptional repressor for pyruvate dehydrogenase complex [Solirubrobacteraceae bacterium]
MSTDHTFTLSPVARSSLAETVAHQLLEEIRAKRLAPGTKLPSERHLMNALGVGRSSIREAINGLAMLGAVEVRHGQGAFVTETASGIAPSRAIAVALARGVTRELFEARRLVETETACRAAERRTDVDLAEIAQAIADHETAVAAGASAVEPAVRFHVEIAEAAHNEVLAGFVGSFAQLLGQRGPVLEEIDGYREWEIEQHRSVYEPVKDGDAELAGERMRAHLDAVVVYHERVGLK